MRGELIALGAHLNRERGKTRAKLANKIAKLEMQHKQFLDALVVTELEQAHTDLRGILEASFRRSIFYKTKFFFEHRNRNSKFLANYLRTAANFMTVHSLRGPQDQNLFTSADIAKQFRLYYEWLYQCPQDTYAPKSRGLGETKINTFLFESLMPSLDGHEADLLEAPFTTAELETALSRMKPGKAPGPDGLTMHYYKAFTKKLVPQLLQVFNSFRDGPPQRSQFLQAYITVIPKPDKDPQYCSNHRPISLLNNDLKLFSK